MELLQLKYFQTLAQIGNMTRAAEALHIAQPSLSSVISRLEKELGIQLFDRRGKRLYLNTAGEQFLRHVDKIFNELNTAHQELADLKDPKQASITIGATSARLLPTPLTEYIKQHSHGKFRILQLSDPKDVQQQLISNKIDLALSFSPIEHPLVQSQILAHEDICLAVAPEHHLASKRHIQLIDAANEHFISITTEHGFRELTNGFCRQAGFIPNVEFEINSLEIIANLVKSNMGVAFMPKYWFINNPKELVQLNIDQPICQRSIWLSSIKDGYMPPIVKNFHDFTVEYFSKN